MKYCLNCKKKFNAEYERCPTCGKKLYEISKDDGEKINESEAAEIISTMIITGIL